MCTLLVLLVVCLCRPPSVGLLPYSVNEMRGVVRAELCAINSPYPTAID